MFAREVYVMFYTAILFAFFCLLPAHSWSDDDTPTSPEEKFTSDQRRKIVRFFSATAADFEDNDALTLTYNFKSKQERLVSDWSKLDNKKGRLRWTKPGEGAAERVSGILIASKGRWTHKAVWTDVVVIVELTPMSTSRKGDIVAATFSAAKGKHAVGTNGGVSLGRVSGLNLVSRGRTPVFVYNAPIEFGYVKENKLFSATKNHSTTIDSSQVKSFLKKLEAGRIGLLWNGQVNCIITKVTISGKLDRDWALNHKPSKKKSN